MAARACLLTYLPSTYAAPLQVSTSQTPVTGLLHSAAINQGTKPVYCNKVLVTLIAVMEESFEKQLSREKKDLVSAFIDLQV